MREYSVEKGTADHYKNGVLFFEQPAEPMCVAAGAHIHDAIEILYIKAGGYTAYLEDEEYNLFAGDLLLIRSGTIHHVVADAQKTHAYYVLKIRPELLRDLAMPQTEGAYALMLSLSRPTSRCYWSAADLPASTKAGLSVLIRDFYVDAPYNDITIKLAAGAILLGLLRTDTAKAEETAGKGRETDKIVYEVMAYVRRHYAEDISAQMLAVQFNLSYSYFSRVFKATVGRSFKEYVNNVRINHAERLLCSGNQSIGEIAQACGYSDVSYFIKVFRQMKGVSPKAYRKAN